MPPRRRGGPRVGLKRIDAALDAVRPMGFPEPLVRKTVKALLKEYGGEDCWSFIEDGCYTVLIDTLIEEAKKSDSENNIEQRLLPENDSRLFISNGKDDVMNDESEDQVHDPTGHSKQVQSPTLDIIPFPSENDATNGKHRVQVHSPDDDSEQIQSPSIILSPPPLDIIQHPLKSVVPDEKPEVEAPSQRIHSVLASSSQINSSCVSDTVPCSLKDVKLKKQSSPHIFYTGIKSAPQLFSPSVVESLPPRKRKPCYGWLSSDDEEEPNYATPAT